MTYSCGLSGGAKDPLQGTRCLDGFPGTPLPCITNNLMAWSPDQILPMIDGRELADGLCWDRRAGRISYIKLVRKAMPSKAHQVYCGLVSAGNMGWETAGKQQLSCNGGASKGLAEVADALIDAAPLIMARAASRSEKACDADSDAETPSLPSSSDIQRNT